ncbi:MAG TPA: PDZ domain-containing protein [Gemmatimonadaceae bacterium]|nr:PDZ domain-containing protein [Gemmatimonadaceae bacterium]
MAVALPVRKRMSRGAVLVASVVASGAMLIPLGAAAAQDTPAPSCVGCDSAADARADRELAEATARLETARRAMVDAMKLAMAGHDSTGTVAEALARANGQLRRAQERFEIVTNTLLRRRMTLERMDMDRAKQAARAATRATYGLTTYGPPGYLGVTFSASTNDVQQEGGKTLMRFDGYPTIESVDPDSPAERAGIESGDKLISLNGKDVTVGCEPLSSLLKPGSHLRLSVKRGSDTKQLTALIAKRPTSGWAQVWAGPVGYPSTIRVTPAAPASPSSPVVVITPSTPAPETPDSEDVEIAVPEPSPMPAITGIISRLGGASLEVVAGAEVRPVGNLADYFGVSQGVLVLRVESGTVAARSGLQDGDVIVRAGGHAVATPSGLSRALYRASDTHLQLDVVRLKKKKSIQLKWDK